MGNRESQKGVALVTVLLIVSLSATVATAMLVRKDIEAQRQASIRDWGQAYQVALGVEAWGMQILLRDLKESGKKDTLSEEWATLLPPMSITGGEISGKIEDLQGRFNLNNLKWEGELEKLEQDLEFQQFQRLLESAGGDSELAYAVVDWIDQGQALIHNFGAEDAEYMEEVPPYRAGNRFFASASELLLVKGITREIYQQLKPYVIALPESDTLLNVNTVSMPLLLALDPVLNDERVKMVEEQQRDGGFASLSGFASHAAFQGSLIDKQHFLKNLGLYSKYFQVTADITVGKSRLKYAAVIVRLSDVEIYPLYRTFEGG